MKSEKLSLTEMLRIAERVDNWEWKEKPKFYSVDVALLRIRIDFENPKETNTFYGDVQNVGVFLSKTGYPREDVLSVYCGGYELGYAAFDRGRKKGKRSDNFISRAGDPEYDLEGHNSLLALLEKARICFWSREQKKAKQILDFARTLITNK